MSTDNLRTQREMDAERVGELPDVMAGVVTDAELKAAEERVAARKALVAEMDALIAVRDRAAEDATITLVVAIDMECAQGLRRKTRTGYDIGPAAPRDALRRVDAALADWYASGDPHRSAIDAKIAEIKATNEQHRSDLDTINRWCQQGFHKVRSNNSEVSAVKWDEEQCPDCECCTREQCSKKSCSGRCPCTAD